MQHTAYVTGATGFVGINLVRALADQGWNVIILARASSELSDLAKLPISIRHGDITDPDSIMASMPEQPDCIFHVAASTNVWSRNNAQQTRINVDGTNHLVEAAIAKGAGRFIHTSSFVVYGFQPERFNEDSPRLNNNHWINYVSTKIAAEDRVRKAVLAGQLDAVVLNPAHILGPYDRHNWSRMITMVNQQSLPGVPPGGGSFADVREIAKAQIQAFHRGRCGHNYLLGGDSADYLDIVQTVGGLLDKKVPAKAMPAPLLRAVGRVKHWLSLISGKEPDITPESAAMITHHMHCDSSKAQAELGYRFTPVPQLLEDTCRWMRQSGLLQ